jgi:phage repressor protein C with HTH and peptisase S24 domain
MKNEDKNIDRMQRLQKLLDMHFNGKKDELGKFLGYKDGAFVRQMLSGARPISEKTVDKIHSIKKFDNWFSNDAPSPTNSSGTTLAIVQHRIDPDYTLVSADDTESATGMIEYWDVRGSCGGGFLNFEQMAKGNLIKEASFFRKYNVKPENAFAIYADGDSMADFISDGDLVIFDKSKTEPKSGEIFAIEHPDGLRIKTLRRLIDGTWILESRNPDKRKYPDEAIPPSSADLLKICGQYLYRQG